MGSNDQPFDMIFDTGSNWLWVSSNLCDNCPNKPGFNHTTSDSFKVTEDSAKMLNYGSGSVIGYQSNDRVCLNKDMCTDDKFSFLLVVRQEGLKSLASAGLVGLSPKYFEKGADQFTTKLKAAGAIDSTAFSISIA